eukprot:EG_transcript_8372
MHALGRHCEWSQSSLGNEFECLTLRDSLPSLSAAHSESSDGFHAADKHPKIRSSAGGQGSRGFDSRALNVNRRWEHFHHVEAQSCADDATESKLKHHHQKQHNKERTPRRDKYFVFLGDVLFQILQFLAPKDLATACRVSSRWREATLAVPFLDQRLKWWQGDSSTSLESSPRYPTGPPLSEPAAVHVFGLPPLPCDEPLELQLSLRANLQRLGWQTPSLVQRNLIRSLMARRDVMTIAQHLSGKTAGCMIALVAILQQQENFGTRGHSRRKNAPRTQPVGLVVVPSRVAALQAAVYCRWLAQRSPIVTASCYSEAARAPQLRKLGQSVVDILVATPRRLRFLLQENIVTLDNVIFVLLDNLDELIDQSLEATEFVVQVLPQKRISCANSNQDLTATTHPKRTPVMNFLNTSKFLHNEIVIFHEGFSPPPIPDCPRWTTVDEGYD